MFLDYSEWFLLGAFSIMFLYFITHYFTQRGEKYNLYFAIGCLISIIRTITYNMYSIIDRYSVYFEYVRKPDHLSFIWGPFFYILLAKSLFPNIGKKIIIRFFIFINMALTIFILFVPKEKYPPLFSYDYAIIGCMLYATYIFSVALIKRRKFAMALFIANTVFIIGVGYDVICGMAIFTSPFGELNVYTYFIYLYITSVVLARKHQLIGRKQLESQLNFLHAQIQPHFLYNTINTIIVYCRTDPEQSRQLLIELSTYLRGKFKSEKDTFITLKDEIDLIKSYLNIEQVRFEGRLIVEYDIDDECNLLIPCLVLQPIVENAVKHGLMPKKEGGKIHISVKRENESMVVRIRDNGIGMSMNKLSNVLQGDDTGIGLSNTNERLKRYYNTEIKGRSEAGKGTEFIVTIPTSRGKK